VASLSGIPDPQQTTPTSEGLLPPTEPIPELQKLGNTLAAARHQRGIDLEILAERLRIGASQLRALETGDHTHLPEGVFVIALARRVASALDLNIDEAVQALRGSRLMVRPQPRPSLPPAPIRRSKPSAPGPLPPRREMSGPGQYSSSSSNQGPSPWLWGLPLVLGALGLATALGFNAWQHYSRAARPGSAAADANRAVSPPSRPKAPVAASAAAPPPAAAAAPSKLRLQASEPSWIQVRQIDGKVIFEGTLTGEQIFSLGQGLEVLAGRPYAVLASVGDGSARPLGPVDDLSWHRFKPTAAASPSASPTAAPITAPTGTTTDSPSPAPKPQPPAPAAAAP
jgi:cytoskeletal protein RodZ